MSATKPLPFSIRRTAVRAHRSRSMQIKMLHSLTYLHRRGLKPMVPSYTFYARQHSSYRQATGHDLKTMGQRTWERIAEKAFKWVLS